MVQWAVQTVVESAAVADESEVAAEQEVEVEAVAVAVAVAGATHVPEMRSAHFGDALEMAAVLLVPVADQASSCRSLRDVRVHAYENQVPASTEAFYDVVVSWRDVPAERQYSDAHSGGERYFLERSSVILLPTAPCQHPGSHSSPHSSLFHGQRQPMLS